MASAYLYQDHLETERLITRFLTIEDIPLWSQFFNSEEATAFIPTFDLASSRDRAAHWIKRQLTRYQEHKFGLQALLLKETGELIGQCGLVSQEVDEKRETEVGYHILRQHWGKGYATEAARAFIEYALQNKVTDTVISIIDIRNIQSQRVAEKNGLTRVKQIKWSGVDVYIYRISSGLTSSGYNHPTSY